MIKLRVKSNYSSGFGSYSKGAELELDDAVAALLLRDSPSSFEAIGAEPEPDIEEATDAMSTETATGLVVPDRRQRGGGKR